MPRQPQPNEPFEEPPFEEISGISRMHAQAMETMDDDMVWVGAGMHQVIVYTIGRKSGNEHKIVVPVWYDDDGHRIVVASYAGAEKHPHWYLNLADKTAEPGGPGEGAGPRVLGRRADPRRLRLRRHLGRARRRPSVLRELPDPHRPPDPARPPGRAAAGLTSEESDGHRRLSRGSGVPRRSARVPRTARGAQDARCHERRRAESSRPELDVRPPPTLPRVAARAVRQRVGRHHLAQGVRRPRRHRHPAGDLLGGRVAVRRAGRRVHRRDRHGRAHAHGARHARAAGALPRPDAARRRAVVPAVQRAGCRLRPRHARHACGARRRRVGRRRAEGVELVRAVLRLGDPARAHRSRRSRSTAASRTSSST